MIENNHTMKFATAHFIKNNYPENILIKPMMHGPSRYSVDVYLTESGEIVKHLLTSEPHFRSSGEAKLHAENVCQSIVDDKTLREP